MINSISLEDVTEYVCKDDRKTDDPTVWKFKALTYNEECFLKKLSLKNYNSENQENFIDDSRIYLDVAMIEPSNFGFKLERNVKAKCIIGNTKPWTDESISSIPHKVRDELISFVIKGYSDIDEEELKN